MEKVTMEELIKLMNESEDEFVITIDLSKEGTDGEEAECSVD